MGLPIMPKATALWLIENTTLSFKQIGDFCGLHVLEVQAIADGESGTGVPPMDPISNGQLTFEEIERCTQDPTKSLVLQVNKSVLAVQKSSKYTPISRRQDRPDAIAWIVKNHPELADSQIVRLLGTTKTTIEGIRSRSHWNINNIKARNPVALGFCTEADLDKEIAKANRKK
jgi:hypothetical protein